MRSSSKRNVTITSRGRLDSIPQISGRSPSYKPVRFTRPPNISINQLGPRGGRPTSSLIRFFSPSSRKGGWDPCQPLARPSS